MSHYVDGASIGNVSDWSQPFRNLIEEVKGDLNHLGVLQQHYWRTDQVKTVRWSPPTELEHLKITSLYWPAVQRYTLSYSHSLGHTKREEWFHTMDCFSQLYLCCKCHTESMLCGINWARPLHKCIRNVPIKYSTARELGITSSAPTMRHWRSLQHVMRYIHMNPEYAQSPIPRGTNCDVYSAGIH